MTELYKAVKDNDIEEVKRLLVEGADVNVANIEVKDENGSTALHKDGGNPLSFALWHDLDEIVRLLLCYGAGGCRKQGDSERLEIVKRLLETDILAKNKHGNTSMHVAAKEGDSEIMKLLLKERLDVNVLNNHGDTPLHVASGWGRFLLTKVLLENGANINAQGSYGYTPLHYAIESGHSCIVKLLLQKGADTNITDEVGRRPSQASRQIGYKEIPNLLKQHGMKNLSPSQARLLEAIARLTRDIGKPPTIRELADELGIKPPSVFDGILRLEVKGLVRKKWGKARSVEII